MIRFNRQQLPLFLNMQRKAIFSLVFTFMLLACSPGPILQKLEGYAQGTSYHISFWTSDNIDLKALKLEINQEFAQIDQMLSNYRPDSNIEQFNSQANTESQSLNPEIIELVKTAQMVNQFSQGCYDLTIKPLFDLWGFKADKLSIPSDAQLQATMQNIGMAKLAITDEQHLRKSQSEVKVDLSSIAQGYSVGRMAAILSRHQIKNYLVEIGGELQTAGARPDLKPWRIAIEKPTPNAQTLHKIIDMPTDSPMSVMTSGTYRHYFDADGKRYSHILDARTGKPVTHNLVSVTVIHPDPSLADAWSTALLCLGEVEGRKLADQENMAALFITQENDQLLESKSQALVAAKNIIFH